jgi:hypothetical protein
LLLAIGPALLALALATAHKAPSYVPQFTTNPAGVKVVTSYVLARAGTPYFGEVRLGQRLMIAALLIVTVLVHGGAAISVGLGFATTKVWSRRALAAAVGLIVLVVFVLPLCLIMVNNGRALDAVMLCFVMASDSLLTVLVTRVSFSVADMLWSVMFCDVVIALFAIGVSWWTMRVWKCRLSDVPKAKPSLATDLHDGRPAAEAVLIGD